MPPASSPTPAGCKSPLWSGWRPATSATRRSRRGARPKRATDALILARTGEEPRRSTDTGAGLREIARRDVGARSLRARYYERQGALHGECFYIGLCEPVEGIERLIRETADYIEDARRLAGV